MTTAPAARLRELERVAPEFGGAHAARKCTLLDALAGATLANANQVLRLHEVLCFLRALPDDASVLERVEGMLDGFPRRADLRRYRAALADSGIAGTDIHFSFYAPSARWLTTRWGSRLTIDWPAVEDDERLKDRLYLLALDAETPGLDHARLSAREWVERMKRPTETDATFLVRRFAAVRWDENLRDVLFNELSLPFVLAGGPDGPSRTHARLPGGRVVWQEAPPDRRRPDLRHEAKRPPVSIRSVSRREGRAVLDLARAAMVTRARDLDAFLGGDADDVRMVDCGGGLEFAVIGAQPDWRMLLEGVYGWLILRNRVPVGYVLSSALFRSSEIAFNVFDTWRGGDAAYVYGRVLATCRTLFGSETFTIYPYQLGHGNPEGLASGAWWFYQKLGFRPRDPDVLALMRRELGRMRRDPRHRSDLATLEALSRANVYLEVGRSRKAVMGTFPFGPLGLAVTRTLAERFGPERERGETVCADEAARRLGVRDWRRLPPPERKAWRKWGPIVVALPGVERWSRAERRALARIVRAKGGRRESDYVKLFDAHPRLTGALLRLAAR